MVFSFFRRKKKPADKEVVQEVPVKEEIPVHKEEPSSQIEKDLPAPPTDPPTDKTEIPQDPAPVFVPEKDQGKELEKEAPFSSRDVSAVPEGKQGPLVVEPETIVLEVETPQAEPQTEPEQEKAEVSKKTDLPGEAPLYEKSAVSSEEEQAPVTALPQEKPSAGLFSKLKSGLAKTRTVLNTDVTELFSSAKHIDEELFEELEERLILSDLGMDITMEMMERIRKKSRGLSTADQLRQVLKDELFTLFYTEETPKKPWNKPHVIMMVGVNGTGKTTTLGKLAMKYKNQGKKVLIAAADTFRAAAIEQVEIWAQRAQADIVRHKEGADPAAVAYDAVEAAMARGADVVLIDTAGRLHTQKNLMEELKKIKRSVDKKYKGAPHEVMMVIDATTGQNALSQADIFNKAVGLTQISVTKLDGTAKGGIVAAVSASMKLPISHIGVGEAIEDLQEFDARQFVDALFD